MSLWKSGVGRMPQIFILELKRALRLSLLLKELNTLTKKSWPMRKKKKKSLKSSLFGVIEESNLFDGSHLMWRIFPRAHFVPVKIDYLSQAVAAWTTFRWKYPFMQPLSSLSACSSFCWVPQSRGNCVGHSFLLLWSYNNSLTHTGVEKVYCCIILYHCSFYWIRTRSQLVNIL